MKITIGRLIIDISIYISHLSEYYSTRFWDTFNESFEKNRDRYEYREYRIINDASFVSKTEKQWPFLKSVGYVEQIRILVVRDEEGNDITPSKEQFLLEGSIRQPVPGKGEREKDDIQIVGIVSDREMSAKEMGRYKRNHWGGWKTACAMSWMILSERIGHRQRDRGTTLPLSGSSRLIF